MKHRERESLREREESVSERDRDRLREESVSERERERQREERERERDESGLRRRSNSGNLDPSGERKDEGEGEVLFVRVYERERESVCARARTRYTNTTGTTHALIKVGSSDLSRSTVSLTATGKSHSHDSVHKPECVRKKPKADLNCRPSAYQHNTLPLGQTGSQKNVGDVDVIVYEAENGNKGQPATGFELQLIRVLTNQGPYYR